MSDPTDQSFCLEGQTSNTRKGAGTCRQLTDFPASAQRISESSDSRRPRPSGNYRAQHLERVDMMAGGGEGVLLAECSQACSGDPLASLANSRGRYFERRPDRKNGTTPRCLNEKRPPQWDGRLHQIELLPTARLLPTRRVRSSSNWGGWIRTTDLPINSRMLCHSATPHSTGVHATGHYAKYTVSGARCRTLESWSPAAKTPARTIENSNPPSVRTETLDQLLDGLMKVLVCADAAPISPFSGQPPRPPAPRAGRG